MSKADPTYKRAYEFGEEWSPYVPRQSIKEYMGGVHVNLTSAEVAQNIIDLCNKNFLPKRMHQRCVDYALHCYRANQDLYDFVTFGKPMPPKRIYRGKHA